VDDGVVVETPIYNSPAYRAGIRAGDVITKIAQLHDASGKLLDEPLATLTKDLTVEHVEKMLHGKQDTRLLITLRRDGSDKPIEVEVPRWPVDPETVLGFRRKADGTWEYWADAERKIAYVRLTMFTSKTAKELEAAVKELERQRAKGLVLDLRGNPGGLLRAAVGVADLFVGNKPIVGIRPRTGDGEKFSGQREMPETSMTVVCLVNGETKSAAEIVAACLQDHQRAVIVGERSFGKGCVQNIVNFEGGRFTLTIAAFYRPSGKCLNRSPRSAEKDPWGVTPDADYLVSLTAEEGKKLATHLERLPVIYPAGARPKDDFADRQLERARDYLRMKVRP
jgi:carboxyl-terminal processing protease